MILARIKKGQAAIEYLFSYGWVLLLMFTIVFIALNYGLLSPERYIQEKCNLGDLIACKDYAADKDGMVQLILTNNYEFGIWVWNLTIPDFPESNCMNTPIFLNPGLTDMLICDTHVSWNEGSKERLNIKVHYWRDGGTLNHTMGGQLSVKIVDDLGLSQCGDPGTWTWLCTGGEHCSPNNVVINYSTGGGVCCIQPCQPAEECRNGIDDDDDGCIDFGFDTGCMDAEDPSEGPEDCAFNSNLETTCIEADGVCCAYGCTEPIPQYYCDQSGGTAFCCQQECAVLA